MAPTRNAATMPGQHRRPPAAEAAPEGLAILFHQAKP